ncbi:hypothetical protein OY671_007811, partial [Metschnikowia pulcherrima]
MKARGRWPGTKVNQNRVFQAAGTRRSANGSIPCRIEECLCRAAYAPCAMPQQQEIALDQRDDQGQSANPVRFAGADLIKSLRLCKGGFHYDEINDWCKRMVATTISSESSIFSADRRQYASDTFHVFDRVVSFGEELNDGRRSDYYEVFLSHWQLTNFNQGYLLPLD